MVETYSLNEREKSRVREVLTALVADTRNCREEYFLHRAALYAHNMPFDLKMAFQRLRLYEGSCGLLVTGNPVDPEQIGPTPRGHVSRSSERRLSPLEMLHGLYASLLGEPFGFDGQQDGRVFNDLIPIEGQPGNSSSGSGEIGLHTEDCLRPFMPDYLGLCCLRNEEGAVTTYSLIRDVELPLPLRQTLMQVSVRSGELLPRPARHAGQGCLLFGVPDDPYLQLSPLAAANRNLQEAAAVLRQELIRKRRTLVLRQGDALYLDNYRAVHGRMAYEPRHDGSGRWFSRLVVLRDMRRTRMFREAAGSRVMLRATYEQVEREIETTRQTGN
jgi:hypothetical protein